MHKKQKMFFENNLKANTCYFVFYQLTVKKHFLKFKVLKENLKILKTIAHLKFYF